MAGSPLQSAARELAEAAVIVGNYKDADLRAAAKTLERIAGMLRPLNLGEFGTVQKDGSIVPTGRVRMPRLCAK